MMKNSIDKICQRKGCGKLIPDGRGYEMRKYCSRRCNDLAYRQRLVEKD